MDSKISVYGANKPQQRISTHGRTLVQELIKGKRKKASYETILDCIEKDGQYAPLFRYKEVTNPFEKFNNNDCNEYSHHDSNALHLLLGLDYSKSFIILVLSLILETCPNAASMKNAQGKKALIELIDSFLF